MVRVQKGVIVRRLGGSGKESRRSRGLQEALGKRRVVTMPGRGKGVYEGRGEIPEG